MEATELDCIFEANQGAILSECKNYRYILWRTWNRSLEKVFFIGLNPSTADAIQDDPTLRRCIGFARSWGFGGLWLGNLFSWRSKSPNDLKHVVDPIGPVTDDWLGQTHGMAKISIAMWGNYGCLGQRGDIIHRRFLDLYCFGLTQLGQPRHALYLKSNTQYFFWQ